VGAHVCVREGWQTADRLFVTGWHVRDRILWGLCNYGLRLKGPIKAQQARNPHNNHTQT